jgi:crotonobetainyl-CoA:carnitine CoA-transferase CaiB-like acyl-CoA transferase
LAPPQTPQPLPLEGIRIADFTNVYAGRYGTMLLADFGAEVIRVESLQYFPSTTRGIVPRPSQALIATGSRLVIAYADDDPGEKPWNRHAMFNCHARNKLSMTVNLQTSEGRDIVERLVRRSDAVVDNYSAGVMDRLGLSYEVLRGWKPDIIVVQMPAFGLSGPYMKTQAFGIGVEGLCGFTALRGYSDDPEHRQVPSVVHMDAASGPGSAFAVLMAIHYRDRTGEGQFIEFPQAENMLPHLGAYFLDAQMNRRQVGPMGNHHPQMVPHNVYPCRDPETWVAIAVADDTEWQHLCKALAWPDWAVQARLRTLAGRLQHQDEIDAALASWTRQLSPSEVAQHLQAHRVTAGPVLSAAAAYQDPHLRARGFFETAIHAEAGTHEYPGMLWQMSHTPGRIRTPPCCLGEHNDYVYGTILGYSPEEIAAFAQAGHIGDTYVEAQSEPDDSGG